MNREEKRQQIEELRAELGQATGTYLTGFSGLTVEALSSLRVEFHKEGVKYRVVKNTLAKKALEGTGMEELRELFEGPTAVAYTVDDPVAPARILKEFAKDHEQLTLKGGFLDGESFGPEKVEVLAKLPSKDEIRAMVLRAVIGVPRGIVTVLNEVPSGLVRVIDARRKQLDEGEEAAA